MYHFPVVDHKLSSCVLWKVRTYEIIYYQYFNTILKPKKRGHAYVQNEMSIKLTKLMTQALLECMHERVLQV